MEDQVFTMTIEGEYIVLKNRDGFVVLALTVDEAKVFVKGLNQKIKSFKK